MGAPRRATSWQVVYGFRCGYQYQMVRLCTCRSCGQPLAKGVPAPEHVKKLRCNARAMRRTRHPAEGRQVRTHVEVKQH